MPGPRLWDRAAAHADFSAGASLTSIAKRAGLSRQAIAKVARDEGWERTGVGTALAATATGMRLLKPVAAADFALLASGKKSMLSMTRILDVLRAGGTRTVAAQTVGIDPETLRRWLLDDGDFARLVDQAEGDKTMRRIGHLEAASERGDTPATRFLLERDPASRKDFGATSPNAVGEGGGVTLNLHFSTDAGTALRLPPVSVARTIDHPDTPAIENSNLNLTDKG